MIGTKPADTAAIAGPSQRVSRSSWSRFSAGMLLAGVPMESSPTVSLSPV
jgi:hypothetical protein